MRTLRHVFFAALAISAAMLLGVTAGHAVSARIGPDCKEQAAVVVIDLADARYPNITDHIRDAIRQGEPEFMTLARDQAKANRRASLSASGLPSRPSQDRDEYPMAFSDEGGRTADVRYVPDTENQSSGSVVGHALSGFCDGQRFTVK
jgi:hypothetical protein